MIKERLGTVALLQDVAHSKGRPPRSGEGGPFKLLATDRNGAIRPSATR